jgi:hypothetical protein
MVSSAHGRGPSAAWPACAAPIARRPGSDGSGVVAASRTSTSAAERVSRTRNRSTGSGSWQFHPRGRTSGSVRPRTVTSRPWGTDARGRKQYRYHDDWRARRDREKFEAMVGFARALPDLRERTARHRSQRSPTRERVLAGAVRLLDRGFFRIGGESYAEENDTYGLATMKRRHVRLLPENVLVFDYTSKGGKRRLQSIVDPAVYRLIGELKRRRGGSNELLAYKAAGRWRDVRSGEVNEYIKTATGGE